MGIESIKHYPYGDLALICMKGCEEIAAKVDYYLMQWRGTPDEKTFVIKPNCPRFGTGEAKAVFPHTARGIDAILFAIALITELHIICTEKQFL